MHLGNLFTALLSWLSVKSRGGRWVLRIEDLDPQRSREEWARLIEDDLVWLGLEWDEGGLDGLGPNGPYLQSRRGYIYEAALESLNATGYTYRCRCTRADLMAVNAPHQSDGRLIYPGTCRPQSFPSASASSGHGALRLYVPDEEIGFTDGVYGDVSVNLARECGDFIVRRADGAWAYQLAVTVDDALMGVTEVARGCDLLLSASQQIYLRRLLGMPHPSYIHFPLVCNSEGRRLSKRDAAMSMDNLRRIHTPASLLGMLANMAGLLPEAMPVTLSDLLSLWDPAAIGRSMSVCVPVAKTN